MFFNFFINTGNENIAATGHQFHKTAAFRRTGHGAQTGEAVILKIQARP